jgi:DUF4097 and DUF4098 domain-containing protein YvlB
MRQGAMSTVAGAAIGVSLVVLGALVGLGLAGCALAGPRMTDVRSYGIDGPVRALDLVSQAGAVEVRATDGSPHVTETVQYRGSLPATSHDLENGTLALRNESCTDCSVSYLVEVSARTTVHVHTNAGAIRLTGLSGDLTIETDAGDIEGTGLGSAHTTVTSQAGKIGLGYQAAPSTVDARTDAGSVDIRVPGTGPYAVDAGTRAGHTSVGVPTDPNAIRKISAHTDAGAVTVAN